MGYRANLEGRTGRGAGVGGVRGEWEGEGRRGGGGERKVGRGERGKREREREKDIKYSKLSGLSAKGMSCKTPIRIQDQRGSIQNHREGDSIMGKLIKIHG